MMKNKLAIFAFLLTAITSQAQYNGYTMHELFFGHQPSARAEALGQGYGSIGGDIYSTFYNPAGLGQVQGLQFDGNYSSAPSFMLDEAYYSYLGIGYNINKYIQCAISEFHFDWGQDISFTDENGNIIGTVRPYSTNYVLTASSNPINNLYLGVNANLILYKPLDIDPFQSWTFDFGALQAIPLFKDCENLNALQAGASIKNFTGSKMKFEYNEHNQSEELPVIARIGLNYTFGLKPNANYKDLRIIQAMALIEYQDVLNYKYLSAYRIGCEATVFEILALRIGYYYETWDDLGQANNYNAKKDFTYGLGINVPFEKITKNNLPLNIKINYTNLKQPGVSVHYDNVDNFNSVGLSVNYRFGARKGEEAGEE